MTKRIISALLAVLLIASLGTVGVLADDETPNTVTQATETSAPAAGAGEGETEEEESTEPVTMYVSEDGKATERAANADFEWLSNAINAAKDGDTIVIQRDMTKTIDGLSHLDGAIYVNKAITIDGGGHTIKAGGSSGDQDVALIRVGVGGVTIKDLIVDGAAEAAYGIEVLPDTGVEDPVDVNLEDITVKNCKENGLYIDALDAGSKVEIDGITGELNGIEGENTKADIYVNANSETEVTIKDADLDSGKTTGTGESTEYEYAPSVVVSSVNDGKTTVTIESGSFNEVKLFYAENANEGFEGAIVINGGTFKNVIAGDGDDSLTINGGDIETLKRTSTGVKISASDCSIDKIVDGSGTAYELDELAANGFYLTNVTMQKLAEDGKTYVDETVNTVVATITGKDGEVTPYLSLNAAINACGDNKAIELAQDVEITDCIEINGKSVTIDGNGHKISAKPAQDSQAISVGADEELILEDVDVEIIGEQGKNMDGVDVYGTLTLDKGATVSVSNVRSAFVMQGGDKSAVNVKGGAGIRVYNITGNASNGGDWTVDGGSISLERCDSFGLSVNTLKTKGDSSISVKETGLGAIYAIKSIELGDGATVSIDNCGKDLPRTRPEGAETYYGDCFAPIQIRVNYMADPGVVTGAYIEIAEGAEVSIVNCKDSSAQAKPINAIYVPEDVKYTNEGALNAAQGVMTPEEAGKAIVIYKNADGDVLYVESAVKNNQYTVQSLGIEGAEWSVNDTSTTRNGGDKLDITSYNTVVLTLTTPDVKSYQIKYTAPAGTVMIPSAANEGSIVTVTPVAGYMITAMTVRNDTTGESVPVSGGSFRMPSSSVTVTVTTSPTATTPEEPEEEVYDIRYSYSSVYGTVTGLLEAVAGDTVNVTVRPKTGYVVDEIYVSSSLGSSNLYLKNEYTSYSVYSFVMPASDATVYVSFRLEDGFPINIKKNVNTRGTVTFEVEGDDDVDFAEEGDDVDFFVDPKDGYVATKIEVTYLNSSNRVRDVDFERVRDGEYTFEMPEGEVTIEVTFEEGYEIEIESVKYGEIWTDPEDGAAEDDTVRVYYEADTGYKLNKITVKTGRNFTETVSVKTYSSTVNYVTFTMPDDEVRISAEFVSNSMPFNDVSRSQWFYDSVFYVWSNGMMEGTETNVFSPNGTMTRAMFWAVLGRIDGEDITGANWINDARDWAVKSGVSDGTNPYGLVTREEMVTMLWRYDGSHTGSASLSGFTDSSSVASYATEAMRWAIGNDIIEGMTATTIAPKGTATRAQCAAIFMRYAEM